MSCVSVLYMLQLICCSIHVWLVICSMKLKTSILRTCQIFSWSDGSIAIDIYIQFVSESELDSGDTDNESESEPDQHDDSNMPITKALQQDRLVALASLASLPIGSTASAGNTIVLWNLVNFWIPYIDISPWAQWACGPIRHDLLSTCMNYINQEHLNTYDSPSARRQRQLYQPLLSQGYQLILFTVLCCMLVCAYNRYPYLL